MTKSIELTLDIGATFNPVITLDSSQTGRTHRAHIRETVASTSVMLAFATGAGITLAGDTVTLYAGADVTELLNLSTDSAHWVIGIESVGATAADVRREARGTVLISRDVTRLTESTPAANASKLLTYSLTDGQTLTSGEQAHVREKIGAGTGGGSSGGGGVTAYGDLTGLPTLGTAAPLNVAASGNAAAGEVAKGNDTRLSDARTPSAHTQALSTITQSGAAVGDNPRWSGTAWVPAAPSAGGGASDPRGAYLAANTLHAWPLDEITGTRFDRKNSAHLLEIGGAVGSAIVGGRRVLSTSGGAPYLSANNAGGLQIGSPNKYGVPESGRTYCFWMQQVNNSMPVVLLPYPGTLRFYYSDGLDIYPHGTAITNPPPQAWMFICLSLGSSNQISLSAYGIPTITASVAASNATEINVGNSPVFGSPPLQMRDFMIFDIGPDKFRQEHYEFLFNFGTGRHWSELV